MPSRRPGSITRRLIIASLCTFPLLLILTGIAIARAYTTSLLNAEQQRLKLQFFGLLGAMEWQRDNLNMSERLREPRFSQFRSGLCAQITNQQGKILWRSLSAETLELPIAQTPPAPRAAARPSSRPGRARSGSSSRSPRRTPPRRGGRRRRLSSDAEYASRLSQT